MILRVSLRYATTDMFACNRPLCWIINFSFVLVIVPEVATETAFNNGDKQCAMCNMQYAMLCCASTECRLCQGKWGREFTEDSGESRRCWSPAGHALIVSDRDIRSISTSRFAIRNLQSAM